MQFAITPANIIFAITLAAGFNTAAAAPGRRQSSTNVDQCSVTHGSSGNTFSIHVANVQANSESTICGHSQDQINSAAKGFSVNVNGGVQCSTDNLGMELSVTLDKQSPQQQLKALEGGITNAFGTAGVTFQDSVCDLSSIPV